MMSSTDSELEVKYHINDLSRCQESLQSLGAVLAKPRILEKNLRFDTPRGELTKKEQALRLRQDDAAIVTYKGPSIEEGGARLRQEYEFSVSDFQAAKKLFEALGFQVFMLYEKFRTTYRFEGVEIVLDEMPYGDFLEIEGSDAQGIAAVSRALGLDWDRRVFESYTLIFTHLREHCGWDFRDLSFANFHELDPNLAVVGILPAD
ncbi:MAG: class IV adenylate cyclase [Anaerolineales bacterium]|nr:class IV adenylate cyclase [Anaerolineales bacterium]